jgi:hypothetical protein
VPASRPRWLIAGTSVGYDPRRSATSAPPRAGRACRCVRHARTWPGALVTQRNNDQFRRLWKRSSDGGAADHDGGYCPARFAVVVILATGLHDDGGASRA